MKSKHRFQRVFLWGDPPFPYYTKPSTQTMLLLLMMAFFITIFLPSCKPTSKEVQKPDHIGVFIMADGSSSALQMEKMTTGFIKESLELLNKTPHEYTVQFYNICYPSPHPVSCELRVKKDNSDKYVIEYKDVEKQNRAVDSLNQVSCDSFISGFESSYVNYNPKQSKRGDFTYLNLHLEAIARNLSGAGFDKTVLLLQSDCVDDTPHTKAQPISAKAVNVLNAAAQKGAEIYIATYADIGKEMKRLNAKYLTHYTDFKRVLKTISSQQKHTEL